ncbi:protein SPEAR1-like [Rutidosis leptorrhynchoides]|uniref:protein SPEAR1-like n=1 Tax=Rutidosis leptorrhynchoides TaxID=125765 RepID=UPI003A99BED6
MNYFDDGAGNHDRSFGSSSSRKGKKSNSDKPKQPQRGLGVAQLEKIRLHSQMGFHQTNPHPQEDIRIQPTYLPSSTFSNTSSSTTYNTSSQGQRDFMMGMGELDRSNMKIYGQSIPSIDPRWNASNAMFEAQHYAQPEITRHLFQVEVEDSLKKKKGSDSSGSNSHSFDLNGSQDQLDLELRLSL